VNCSICGQNFPNLNALREHVRTAHPDHKPIDAHPDLGDEGEAERTGTAWTCSLGECDVTFSTFGDYWMHCTAAHPRTTITFECIYCGTQRDSLDVLALHVVTNHDPENPFGDRVEGSQ